jgi:uridine phosphorylase
LEHQHREFATVTGTFRGERISVVSTGIGTDNVEIVVAEILAITKRPTFIRVGSCGALQPEMNLGDLAITTGAVRLESTTSFFVHDGYPAVADYEAVVALIEAAERLGHRYHVGVTATAPGFFGAQGRPIPQLPIRYPDLAEDMARQRVMNFEMEASALLVLSSLARCRAGVVCAVFANRTTGEFVGGAAKDAAEAACVDTGLESLIVLAEMDAQKRAASTDRWRPSLWASETARTR